MSTPQNKEIPPPAVGALLRFAWQDLWAEMYESALAEGFDDLRFADVVHIWRYPGPEGRRPTELAAATNLSKQTINDLLRRAERNDYLWLEPDPRDPRARLIRVTERGQRLFEILCRTSLAIGRRWAREIGQRPYEDFESTLREIVELGRRDGAGPDGNR